jgi:hypothetical protein
MHGIPHGSRVTSSPQPRSAKLARISHVIEPHDPRCCCDAWMRQWHTALACRYHYHAQVVSATTDAAAASGTAHPHMSAHSRARTALNNLSPCTFKLVGCVGIVGGGCGGRIRHGVRRVHAGAIQVLEGGPRQLPHLHRTGAREAAHLCIGVGSVRVSSYGFASLIVTSF